MGVKDYKVFGESGVCLGYVVNSTGILKAEKLVKSLKIPYKEIISSKSRNLSVEDYENVFLTIDLINKL